jgi:hypothetical protein
MTKIHSEQFEYNGEIYEIAVFATPTGYLVRILLNGNPIGPNYIVSYERAADFDSSGISVFTRNAVESLINAAQEYIRSPF